MQAVSNESRRNHLDTILGSLILHSSYIDFSLKLLFLSVGNYFHINTLGASLIQCPFALGSTCQVFRQAFYSGRQPKVNH